MTELYDIIVGNNALYIHAFEINLTDLLRRKFTMSFQPPANSLRKAADSMMQTVLLRYLALFGELSVKYATEIVLEILQKDLAAFSGQYPVDALLFLLQVIEKMC